MEKLILGFGLSLLFSTMALAEPVQTTIGGLKVSCSDLKKDIDKFESSMQDQDSNFMKFESKEKDTFLKTFNAIAPITQMKADSIVIWSKADSVILGFEIGKKLCIAGLYDKANFEAILKKAFGDPT